jgi:hypothetical protein
MNKITQLESQITKLKFKNQELQSELAHIKVQFCNNNPQNKCYYKLQKWFWSGESNV